MTSRQIGEKLDTADAFRLLLGRRYNRAKKAQGEHVGNQYMERRQIDGFPTADRLAVEHGVSPRTVERAGQFAAEVQNTPALNCRVRRLARADPTGERRATLAVDIAVSAKTRDAGTLANHWIGARV